MFSENLRRSNDQCWLYDEKEVHMQPKGGKSSVSTNVELFIDDEAEILDGDKRKKLVSVIIGKVSDLF